MTFISWNNKIRDRGRGDNDDKYMPNYKNAHGDNIKNTDITIQGPTTMLT